MTIPSHASAAAPRLSPTKTKSAGDSSIRPTKPSIMSQIKELSDPLPQSFALVAAIKLLEPLEETQPDVFLMTRSYIQNWLIWAFHQKVNKIETARVEEAAKLAAKRLGLTAPQVGMDYHDPGPIDASILAMEGHPLLLKPNVVVKDALEETLRIPSVLRRAKSLPDESEKKSEIGDSPQYDSLDVDGDNCLCCAVPCQFYEVRAVGPDTEKQLCEIHTSIASHLFSIFRLSELSTEYYAVMGLR
jgi:hypothetical protein